VQHAFTRILQQDRKAIKITAENYPYFRNIMTPRKYFNLPRIGEALISAWIGKGRPTPLAATMLRAPMSRMDILTDKELK